MEIVKKLQAIKHTVQYEWDKQVNGEGVGEKKAKDMQALALAAMREGMKTSDEGRDNPDPDFAKLTAWERYIRGITTDHAEFLRLTGRDLVFNQHPWAEKILGYILADGPCTETSFADTARHLKGEELRSLDE